MLDKVLIIDEAHPVLLEKLSHLNVEYNPTITIDELRLKLQKVHILILRSKLSFTAEWIDLAPNLKCIGRLGSGMDNIDVEYASTKGITCFNAPEGNRNAVAEQTVGMLLMLLSKSYKGALEVKERVWDRKGNTGIELKYLTVGIIGYGNVGKQVAKRLSSFECKVVAYDRFLSNYGDAFAEQVSLQKLQSISDIITLHVPLNETSFELVNRSFVDEVSRPFFLLNLARGKVVNSDAIKYGLETGKILGCGIDVFENEKLKTLTETQNQFLSYLINNELVIFTPHIGGLTQNSFYKLSEVLASKILAWL